MKWPLLSGKRRQQPVTGRWHEWKAKIADECGAQCIYCAIHEARFGGIRNFHVEHFRPKAKFPKLENDIRNLYLACAICNVLKCDDWPAEPKPDHSAPGYPDPAACDYNSLFSIDGRTHEIGSSVVAGRYVIERVMLNRAQLILQRRLAAFLARINEFEHWCATGTQDLDTSELREVIQVLTTISALKTAVFNARPYQDQDARRLSPSKGGKRRSRS